MLPNLDSLRCFVQAATLLNFRSAARSVALSPAAFGERIRRLEGELDAKLFERTTRRVALTREGERLLPQAQRCLDEASRCRDALASDAEPPYELFVGTRFELGLSWLVPALSSLERSQPKRRLHLHFGDTVDLVPRLVRDDIQCLITSARLVTPGLELARLHEEAYALVGSRALFAKRRFARAEDARHYTLLDIRDDLPLFRYFVDARPAREAWAFERVQYLGGIAAIRARVLEGAGVAVLPLYYVERDLRSGALRRLFPDTKLPSDWFRLVWRQGHPRAAHCRALAAELARLPLR
jgi:DNA-binding transcriptional LysR family regulator